MTLLAVCPRRRRWALPQRKSQAMALQRQLDREPQHQRHRATILTRERCLRLPRALKARPLIQLHRRAPVRSTLGTRKACTTGFSYRSTYPRRHSDSQTGRSVARLQMVVTTMDTRLLSDMRTKASSSAVNSASLWRPLHLLPLPLSLRPKRVSGEPHPGRPLAQMRPLALCLRSGRPSSESVLKTAYQRQCFGVPPF